MKKPENEYDSTDPFIDDSALIEEKRQQKAVDSSLALHGNFFVNTGSIDVVDRPSKAPEIPVASQADVEMIHKSTATATTTSKPKRLKKTKGSDAMDFDYTDAVAAPFEEEGELENVRKLARKSIEEIEPEIGDFVSLPEEAVSPEDVEELKNAVSTLRREIRACTENNDAASLSPDIINQPLRDVLRAHENCIIQENERRKDNGSPLLSQPEELSSLACIIASMFPKGTIYPSMILEIAEHPLPSIRNDEAKS